MLAAEKVKPWERLRFDLGGYITDFDSDIQFGLESLGAGINVNVEEALGLDTSTTVFRGSASYRFTRNLRQRRRWREGNWPKGSLSSKAGPGRRNERICDVY